MAKYAEKKSYAVIDVGPDELYSLTGIPNDLRWLVYWYEQGSYDGQGIAIFRTADGTYGEEGLGHCSCYGPTETSSWTGNMTAYEVRQLLNTDENIDRPRSPKDYDYARWAAISNVVLGLLADESTNSFIQQSRRSAADREAALVKIITFLKNNGFKFAVVHDCITVDV